MVVACQQDTQLFAQATRFIWVADIMANRLFAVDGDVRVVGPDPSNASNVFKVLPLGASPLVKRNLHSEIS